MQSVEEKVYTPPAEKPVYDICKRIFDLVMSTIALILLSPIFLGVAIAIKREDGGPAIFKPERIGYKGKSFTLYKFRSMIVEAERDGAQLYHSGDDRLTRVGQAVFLSTLLRLVLLFAHRRYQMEGEGDEDYRRNGDDGQPQRQRRPLLFRL